MSDQDWTSADLQVGQRLRYSLHAPNKLPPRCTLPPPYPMSAQPLLSPQRISFPVRNTQLCHRANPALVDPHNIAMRNKIGNHPSRFKHILLGCATPQTHDIRTIVHRILALATGGGDGRDRFRLPLIISQKIVQYLYKTPSQLGRELYATLLEQLCSSYEEVAKEAITWLIYAEDDVSTLMIYLLIVLIFLCAAQI